MRIDAPARTRWAAALAVGSLLAASPELHLAVEGDAAAHGLLRSHEVVATAACELGGRAHFEPAESRIARPCAACLRGSEQRAVAPAPAPQPAADLGDRLQPELAARLHSDSFHGPRTVRGPPVSRPS